MDLLNILINIAAAILGCLLIYVALFTYEDEKGAISDRISSWWVAIDDLVKKGDSFSLVFMQQTSKVTAQLLNRLFGGKLLSWHSVSMSTCISTSSYFLYVLFCDLPAAFHGLLAKQILGELGYIYPQLIIISVVLGTTLYSIVRNKKPYLLAISICVFLTLGVSEFIQSDNKVILSPLTIPKLTVDISAFERGFHDEIPAAHRMSDRIRKEYTEQDSSAAPGSLVASRILNEKFEPTGALLNRIFPHAITLAPMLMFGILIDILSIFLTRKIIKVGLETTRPWGFLGSMGLVCLGIIFMSFIGPLIILQWGTLPLPKTNLIFTYIVFAYALSFSTNIFAVVGSILFFLVMLVAVVSKYLMPVINRFIYAIDKNRVLYNKKVLLVSGVALLIFSDFFSEELIKLLKSILGLG